MGRAASRIRAASERPLKVLVVDDDDASRSGLAAAVAFVGHECSSARNGAEALEMVRDERVDVILADGNLPVMDGLALCNAIRSTSEPAGTTPRNAYVYFMFVTDTLDRAHLIEGMRAGADDFIMKPVDLDELEVRLEAARRIVTLYRKLETQNEGLRRDSARSFRAARIDPLTAISNRLRLQEDLDALASRAMRYGHRYCAALCDIDQFKAFNDAFGHVAGDDVLRGVARAIRRALRRGDSFYRYGGEEFLAILPEQSLGEAVMVMDRVRAAVEQLHIQHAPSATYPYVTISVGVAEMSAGATRGMEDWLERADSALYAAKRHGRNRVEHDRSSAGRRAPHARPR